LVPVTGANRPGYGGNPGHPSEAAFAQAAGGYVLSRPAKHTAKSDNDLRRFNRNECRDAPCRRSAHGGLGPRVSFRQFGGHSRAASTLASSQVVAVWSLRSNLGDQPQHRAPASNAGAGGYSSPSRLGKSSFRCSTQPKRLSIASEGGHENLSSYGAMAATINLSRRTHSEGRAVGNMPLAQLIGRVVPRDVEPSVEFAFC
jgi:hypothetical protein